MSNDLEARLKRLSILVIEDDEIAEIHTSVLLKELGATRIMVAKGGQEAISIFKRSKALFNIIMSDWIMPDVSGIMVLQYARRADVPGKFLLMTGNPTPEFVKAARDAGVDAFLVKPLTKAQLAVKLRIVLGLGPEEQHGQIRSGAS